VGHVDDRAAHRDARVQEHDVHRAHLLERGVGERRHRLAVAHVAHHALGPRALRAQLLDRGVERSALDVGDHEVNALARHHLGGREADPARATRDHGHPVA
jgi:hypothetical protein